MVFHRYVMSASLPPSLSFSRRGILFFFFLFHNEQKRGRRIRASLRSDPSRDPRVLFDGTLRRFQSISRRNSRGQKETRSSSTTIHTDCPRQSCVFTRARMRVCVSFPFKYLPTKHSSPSPLLPRLRTKMKTDGEQGEGRNCCWERNCFRISRENFFSSPPSLKTP